MRFIGPIEMDDRRPFFGEGGWSHKNPDKIVQFSLPVLDCTEPEMRTGPTLGSRRPCR